MIHKKESAGGLRTTTADTKHCTPIITLHTCCKAAIVRLALCGLLPFKVAEWLIHRGGLRDV
jgi:hypothetical protein